MSVTLSQFRERSGCTVFRDTMPENINPRAPRLWVELGANEPIAGARKGDHFSDVVLGKPVTRTEAYQRYWKATGMSEKSLEGEVFAPGVALPNEGAKSTRLSGTGFATAMVAGALAALVGFAFSDRRSSKS